MNMGFGIQDPGKIYPGSQTRILKRYGTGSPILVMGKNQDQVSGIKTSLDLQHYL
jgi:hypothetical protein